MNQDPDDHANDDVPSDPSPALETPVHKRMLRPKPLLVRLITEHNPFYLLSAACMLASCLALTNSLSWSPIAMRRLLTLLVTRNVYEAALLGIALFLVTKRGLRRDGHMLLLLQAFFVADFTFLNAEIATSSPDAGTGILINAIVFVLAAIKLGAVMWVLRPNISRMQFGFVMLQLAVLFALPCVLRIMDANRGVVGAKHLYAAWWLAALLPAIYEVIAWLDPSRQSPLPVIGPREQASPGYAAPTRAYLAIPYVSLLTHLGILHWVYDVRFYGAHAAPVMIGLALVINRFSPKSTMPRADALLLRVLLPLGAVLVSANNPFVFEMGWRYPKLVLTPLNVAIGAAFLTYVYCFLLPHAKLFLAVGTGVAAAYVFGPTREQIGATAKAAWKWILDTGDKLVPRTTADWGVIG